MLADKATHDNLRNGWILVSKILNLSRELKKIKVRRTLHFCSNHISRNSMSFWILIVPTKKIGHSQLTLIGSRFCDPT